MIELAAHSSPPLLISSVPIVCCQLIDVLTLKRRPRILVVGDVMLDRYLWGDVERVSPEAPIPVLKVVEQEDRLGGAASVVSILAALDVDVILAAVLGDDADGRTVRDLLEQRQAISECTLTVAGRPTTVKQRFLGRTQSRHPQQQMIRVDRDSAGPIGEELAGRLLEAIERRLPEVDLVLVSDYEKGVCAGQLVPQLAGLARRSAVRVVADPGRDVDFRRYAGCTSITPNRSEAGGALGLKIVSPEDGLEAARRLLAFDVEAAVVTLDRDGIAWADRQGRGRLFPAQPRQVFDITGAGDMVLGALGFGLAAGADWPTAIELANLAGGLEVEKLGVTPLTRRELLASLSRRGFSAKIVSVEQLADELRDRRRVGQRIAMTNGCFDLLHPGHIASLQHARSQADCLVVGVNSDRSIELLKGPGRPVIDQAGRAEVLAAIGCVDYVVIFDDISVAGLVEQVAPDVLVKSAEYSPEEVVGHEIVRRQGGAVALAPRRGSYSTSGLIAKIRGIAERGPPEAQSDTS